MPKINFIYSWVYDNHWREVYKKEKDYPSERKIRNYIEKVEKLWKKKDKKILEEMAKISGLKWKDKGINCYVVGRCRPFSCPLTMPVYLKYPDYFIDVLIHELFHQLFIQDETFVRNGRTKSKKVWDYFFRKYKNESLVTKIHIPLLAMHKYIYLKFFDENRLERDKEQIKRLKDYKKAWEVVEKEGYKNIIKNFKDRVNKTQRKN